MRKFILSVLPLFLLSLMCVDAAEFKLNRFFSDNMVLQREKPVTILGEGNPGETVTVTFAGQTKKGTVEKDGTWKVVLDAMKASAEGKELKSESGGKEVTVSDILVGDVYMFARQSRIDVSLGLTEEGKAAASGYKPSGDLRAIVIKTIPKKKQQNDLSKEATSGWLKIDSKNAQDMSAAAFYLGKGLVKDLNIPVGIIDINMGYYYAVGWMSEKAITDSQTMHPKDKTIPWLPEWINKITEERDSGKEKEALDKEHAAKVKRYGEKKAGRQPSMGLHPLQLPMFPSAGYNSVLYPLRYTAMKGLILQLGNDYPFIAYMAVMDAGKGTDDIELNQAWGQNYWIMKHGYRVTPVTLPYIPEDWRRTLGNKDLPIGLVLPPSSDLHPYAIHNREIREMHRRTSEKEKNIGLIMPGMKNVPFSGQPKDEKLLAERCKLWVLGDVEGKKDVEFTGPVIDRVESDLADATVYFKKGTADGLKASKEALGLFEASGPDGEFYPAKAKLNGETIELKCEKAGQIEFVRFNWVANPDMGLVNKAGLPALPFNTNPDWEFEWIPPSPAPNLPMEYSTTADKWSKSDVAIINGNIANMATGDSEMIPRRPGPIGIFSAPFGPNIYVVSIDPGTPAVGKLLPGDVVYGVNGKVFEDDQYRQLADAITFSESDEGKGKLALKVRRGTELMDIDLQLQVLGAYSATTPFYCKKSQNIVKNAEKWISKRYRPEKGLASMPKGMLNTDLLFLMASGKPEHQGLVRRAIYDLINKTDLNEPVPGGRAKPWSTGYNSLLVGEYFHSTGDRNVLPYLENIAGWAGVSQLKPKDETPEGVEAAQTEEQVGGYRQNYPSAADRWKSGYGLMPHAGMTCVMGMLFAKEAGLKVDELALKRGLKHFHDGRAEVGYVVYGYSNTHRDAPPPMDPEALTTGNLWSMNGKLGTAAALYSMVDEKKAVDACAKFCVYGYNRTRSGHGGMFFNNFWTPIGANAAGENAFKHFMKGQRWWRELFRRSDGSFNQVGRGGIGVSYGLPYVAHEKRLRILGAPKSVFGGKAPEYLKPAIEAHKKRDYATAEKLVQKVLKAIKISPEEMPAVKQFQRVVETLKKSVDHDLALTQQLIDDGKYYYASVELPQLKGVVAEDDMRLKKIVAALESPEGKAGIASSQKAEEKITNEEKAAAKASKANQSKEKWIPLLTQAAGTATDKGLSSWRMKLVEGVSQAPKDWTEQGFDDSKWMVAELPKSWAMYHTVLFRGKFNIKDKSEIDKIRFLGKFFQQNNVQVYLNGELVAKVDEIGRGTGNTEGRLTNYAMDLLKNGENTIAFYSCHKRRWGAMRGKYTTAGKVDFKIEARKKTK